MDVVLDLRIDNRVLSASPVGVDELAIDLQSYALLLAQIVDRQNEYNNCLTKSTWLLAYSPDNS